MHSLIYLDYNSTAPIKEGVFESISPFLLENFGNPSNIYSTLGISAKKALEESRKKLAHFIGAKKNEIVFTSSATEANYLAIVGAYLARKNKNHFITSLTEHSSVLETFSFLKQIADVEVSYLAVDSNGDISLEQLANSIRPETNLISLMYVNNETGLISPIEKIVKIAKEKNVLVHSDVVQAITKIEFEFSKSSLDMISLSGHKFGTLKGVGALVIKENTPWSSALIGGGQENFKRGGTEAVPNIVSINKALEQKMVVQEIKELRDQFEEYLKTNLANIKINSISNERICNTSSIQIAGIIAEELIQNLAEKNIIFSSGSACKTNTQKPSHVLKAMGLSLIECLSTIRISFGPENLKEDYKYIADVIIEEVERIRNISKEETRGNIKNV